MNTSITRIGGPTVSLGFVTGDLKNLGQHLAMGLKRAPVRQTQGQWDTDCILHGSRAWSSGGDSRLACPPSCCGFALLDRAAISGVCGSMERTFCGGSAFQDIG